MIELNVLNTAKCKSRNYCVNAYRFGFNGQEKDDEISGVTGGHTTATFWEYDTRIGRRWNTDPVVKHHESPYATFAGNPIWFIDPLGDNADVFITGEDDDAKNESFKQLQSSTNLELNFNRETGQVSAIGGEAQNKNDEFLLKAIEDESVDVKLNASYDINHPAGAFMGTTLSDDKKSVTSNQYVNPRKMRIIDFMYATPGTTILHEVTESYSLGQMSIGEGKSFEKAWQTTNQFGQIVDESPDYHYYLDAHNYQSTMYPKEKIPKKVFNAELMLNLINSEVQKYQK